MKKLLLFTFFVTAIFVAHAQTSETNYFTTFGGSVFHEKNFVTIRGDSVIFSAENAALSVPVDSIASYQFKKGKESTKGFLYGALAGATIGVLIGASTDVDGPQTGLIILDGVLGAAVGGITGALVGRSLSKTEIVDLTVYKTEEKKNKIKALMMDHVSEH